MASRSRPDFTGPPIDPRIVEERIARLGGLRLGDPTRLARLRLIVSLIDLTTLEGSDNEVRVRALCERARLPLPHRPEIGPCAAVCVYPSLVPAAKRALEGSTVKIASVAGAFPSGLSPLDVKLLEVRRALEFGADEIDMVIDRGAMRMGRFEQVFDEITAIKDVCGTALLKVILETGELDSHDLVAKASRIAMLAGADFIKTSTGKIAKGAALDSTFVMLETIRAFQDETGKRIGIKVSGGIRKAEQALGYVALVHETLGEGWLVPALFRIGASSLLDDVAIALDRDD